MSLGPWEILILVAVALLIFGGRGKISQIMGDFYHLREQPADSGPRLGVVSWRVEFFLLDLESYELWIREPHICYFLDEVEAKMEDVETSNEMSYKVGLGSCWQLT